MFLFSICLANSTNEAPIGKVITVGRLHINYRVQHQGPLKPLTEQLSRQFIAQSELCQVCRDIRRQKLF